VKSKRLYITMSIFILVMVGGGTILGVSFRENIQIRRYIWKLDSEDVNEKKKAFDWLKKRANKNIEDIRLTAFFKHPESLEMVKIKPFLFTVLSGDLVDIKIMLDQGEDVNRKYKNGQTLIHCVAEYGKVEEMLMLIEYGAEVDTKNKNGLTPLHQAAMRGYDKVVQVLIKQRANVNTKDNDGLTPLHWAAQKLKGNIEVVEVLIEHGANVNAKDNDGRTPLDWVINCVYMSQKKKQIIINLLRNHGAMTGAELKLIQGKKK